jgi:hypothetical protein
MTYVRETIVTTKNSDNTIKMSPLGVYINGDSFSIKPFKPSLSLENILRNKSGVINYVDDVRIFASCITKRNVKVDFVETSKINCSRIKNAVSHTEFIVEEIIEDKLRPTLFCRPVNEEIHKMYYGFNRAKSAVLELCILASRLGIIEDKKIQDEIKYLKIAIDKTAGEHELEAWSWLLNYIKNYKDSIK